MNLSDIAQMAVTNVKTEGKAIVEATVTGVYATDVLQAEGRAEYFLADVAKANGEVVSADRWELVQKGDGMAKTWSVRFFCS
ncbi:hypothetical protein SEA_ATUIN_31 [Arthrobacter phage Atuin]|nr:hypothetical protein SEA_ATUIN_130 [Arthrobacter phage Atuin]